jgi:hypothetical protein
MPTVDPRDAELAAIRKAYEASVRERSRGERSAHIFDLSQTGQMYASPWVQEEFAHFSAGFRAALRAHPAPEHSAHCSGEVVEVVARAIRDVKGGVGFDYMHFCRDAARAAIAALSAPRPDEGVESLREIAAQKLPDELDNPEDADWREGYVGCVERARAALSHLTTPEKRP